MRVEWPTGLGSVIALLVIVLCLVLAVVGRLDYLTAGLIGATALSRLV